MGLSAIEEQKTNYCLSPKILQPATDIMDCLVESPRKKKSFSSSSFYEEPNAIYPTIEEQVKLCRQIAESLSDDCNRRSKGANMFFRRVKKADKWIVAQSNGLPDGDTSSLDPSQLPYVRPAGSLPKLKLLLAPRPLVDLETLLRAGHDVVSHSAVAPTLCRALARDLDEDRAGGKGSQIFARRKKKAEEWVVDEDKVRRLLQERYHISYPPRPCEEAEGVAQSVIRAAEAKVMTYPNAVLHLPVIHSLTNHTQDAEPKKHFASGPYTCRMPKGWTASPCSSSQPETVPVKSLESPALSPHRLQGSSSPLRRSHSFTNFNRSPRAWNCEPSSESSGRPIAIRSVRPPSVLIQ